MADALFSLYMGRNPVTLVMGWINLSHYVFMRRYFGTAPVIVMINHHDF